MNDPQMAKDKLVQDFNAVIADTEALLKSVTAVGGEKATALRADLERNLHSARERLVRLQDETVQRARATAKATDEYVHTHPWESMAIAAGISAILGIVVGLLLNRR